MGRPKQHRFFWTATKWRQLLVGCIVLVFAIRVGHCTPPERTKVRKVLLVGIDGCWPDALLFSQAKHLKRLVKQGAYFDRCDVLGNRKTRADTASGSGWSTILTGVLADKHGVYGNDFKFAKLRGYPSVLQRVSGAYPKAKCIALVTWPPFSEHIIQGHPGCRLIMNGDKKGYKDGDREMAKKAVQVMKRDDPTLLFVYFGHTDSTGHGYGFHPRAPKYTNAIEEADEHLGKILDAMKNRPRFAQEEWLIVVCTDHGGKGRGHGGGRTVPEIRNGFLIVHGSAAAAGHHKEKVTNADIVPTILKYLRVSVDPRWGLDGTGVGLKAIQQEKN